MTAIMDRRRNSISRRKASSSRSSDSAEPDPQRPPRPSLPSARSRTTTDDAPPEQPKRAAKRKKEPIVDVPMDVGEPELAELEPEEEEQEGVTRCLCGKSPGDEGEEGGEFMVQCETCDVWQHGVCMGFLVESEVTDLDYYCELCRPDLYQERLKLRERERAQRGARASRSHSPTTHRPAKRRNTMNSRAADAYDESLKDVIEASALAAHPHQRTPSVRGASVANGDEHTPPPPPRNSTANKKRKRTADDDAAPMKRTRSASTTSDRAPQHLRAETPASSVAASAPAPPSRSMAAPPAPPKSRTKRGGARTKAAKPEPPPDAADGDDVVTPSVRRATSSRSKGGARRPAAGGNGERARGSARAVQDAYEDGQPHHAPHHGAGAGIGLPDHFAHLEPLFSAGMSARASASAASSSASEAEDVRVRWPAKRMSVGDMNKRVRALLEWVGREQAGLGERGRRRCALVDAFGAEEGGGAEGGGGAGGMGGGGEGLEAREADAMRVMEALMQDLIGFQERFGPGAKGRDRERERERRVS